MDGVSAAEAWRVIVVGIAERRVLRAERAEEGDEGGFGDIDDE